MRINPLNDLIHCENETGYNYSTSEKQGNQEDKPEENQSDMDQNMDPMDNIFLFLD